MFTELEKSIKTIKIEIKELSTRQAQYKKSKHRTNCRKRMIYLNNLLNDLESGKE